MGYTSKYAQGELDKSANRKEKRAEKKNKKAKAKVDKKYGEENRLKARMSQEYSRLNESTDVSTGKTVNPSPFKKGGKVKKKEVVRDNPRMKSAAYGFGKMVGESMQEFAGGRKRKK